MLEKLCQARSGQTVIITDEEMADYFLSQFDGQAEYIGSVADLQAWCTFSNCTFTNNENGTYTITPNH